MKKPWEVAFDKSHYGDLCRHCPTMYQNGFLSGVAATEAKYAEFVKASERAVNRVYGARHLSDVFVGYRDLKDALTKIRSDKP